MQIEIDDGALDCFVRVWLKETLATIEHNAAASYVHPEDAKQFRKDIKAVRRLLDYVAVGP